MRCFAPEARSDLLDQLVGTLLQKPRHIKFELLRGRDIDGQQMFGSKLYREVGWVGALKNFINVRGRTPSEVDIIRCVAHETTCLDILPSSEHARQPIL